MEDADSGRGDDQAESVPLSSLREADRAEGEAGGGMATALGIRARGVLIDGRPIAEEPDADTRPPRLGFGVLNGDPGGRVGEEVVREIREGEGRVRAGLAGSRPRREGVPEAASRELSCLAVMETYLDARDPAVSLSVNETGLALAGLARVRARARAAGVVPGVARPT